MTAQAHQSAIAVHGIEQMDKADRAAILATLARLFAGFARRDAGLLAGVYSADADWINAFGSQQKGDGEIVDYLRGLFDDDNFSDGRVVAGPDCWLRRLDRDNAVVRAHLQIAGQGLVGGGAIALRDNHSMRVISRQADDTWSIVSEMFMDVRGDHTYVNHG